MHLGPAVVSSSPLFGASVQRQMTALISLTQSPNKTRGVELLPLVFTVSPTASWRMLLTLICVSQPTCSGLITSAPLCLYFITEELSLLGAPSSHAAGLTGTMITL
ncbi:hypothetical protein KUDE01_010711, partial [Dissostichus eleginoides]